MLMSSTICDASELPYRINGPAIKCRKQLSVRSEALEGRSLNFLSSSTSNEAIPKTNQNGWTRGEAGGQIFHNFNYVANHTNDLNGGANHNSKPIHSRRQLLQSLSGDDSLGESKCCVGNYTIKITGDHFELVQMAKLALDDYFRSNEFVQSAAHKGIINATSSIRLTPTMLVPAMISHQVKSSSPFTEDGVGFIVDNVSTISNSNQSSVATVGPSTANGLTQSDPTHLSRKEQQEEMTDTNELSAVPIFNGLTRPRRSHFTLKDLQEEKTNTTRSRRTHFSRKDMEGEMISTSKGEKMIGVKEKCGLPVVFENEQLIHYSKSPLSLMLPNNWTKICKMWPSIVPKVCK